LTFVSANELAGPEVEEGFRGQQDRCARLAPRGCASLRQEFRTIT
jgi:hypothetical protein